MALWFCWDRAFSGIARALCHVPYSSLRQSYDAIYHVPVPARATSSGTLSFGLVSIPFKIFTAASAEGVKFHQLHEKCGNRIKYQVYCPTDDEVVDRADLVKGYEYTKGQYVRFEADELKALEEEKTHNLEIIEFVPLDTVDFVYVEKSYYLGPDKGGHKAYRLLSKAMREAGPGCPRPSCRAWQEPPRRYSPLQRRPDDAPGLLFERGSRFWGTSISAMMFLSSQRRPRWRGSSSSS